MKKIILAILALCSTAQLWAMSIQDIATGFYLGFDQKDLENIGKNQEDLKKLKAVILQNERIIREVLVDLGNYIDDCAKGTRVYNKEAVVYLVGEIAGYHKRIDDIIGQIEALRVSNIREPICLSTITIKQSLEYLVRHQDDLTKDSFDIPLANGTPDANPLTKDQFIKMLKNRWKGENDEKFFKEKMGPFLDLQNFDKQKREAGTQDLAVLEQVKNMIQDKLLKVFDGSEPIPTKLESAMPIIKVADELKGMASESTGMKRPDKPKSPQAPAQKETVGKKSGFHNQQDKSDNGVSQKAGLCGPVDSGDGSIKMPLSGSKETLGKLNLSKTEEDSEDENSVKEKKPEQEPLEYKSTEKKPVVSNESTSDPIQNRQPRSKSVKGQIIEPGDEPLASENSQTTQSAGAQQSQGTNLAARADTTQLKQGTKSNDDQSRSSTQNVQQTGSPVKSKTQTQGQNSGKNGQSFLVKYWPVFFIGGVTVAATIGFIAKLVIEKMNKNTGKSLPTHSENNVKELV